MEWGRLNSKKRPSQHGFLRSWETSNEIHKRLSAHSIPRWRHRSGNVDPSPFRCGGICNRLSHCEPRRWGHGCLFLCNRRIYKSRIGLWHRVLYQPTRRSLGQVFRPRRHVDPQKQQPDSLQVGQLVARGNADRHVLIVPLRARERERGVTPGAPPCCIWRSIPSGLGSIPASPAPRRRAARWRVYGVPRPNGPCSPPPAGRSSRPACPRRRFRRRRSLP